MQIFELRATDLIVEGALASTLETTTGEWLIEQNYLSRRMSKIKLSEIRKFFGITATMKDVISLGIGEPDFTTPEPILKAGIKSLERGETHYTSDMGILELQKALSNQGQTIRINKIDRKTYAIGYQGIRV